MFIYEFDFGVFKEYIILFRDKIFIGVVVKKKKKYFGLILSMMVIFVYFYFFLFFWCLINIVMLFK